MDEILTKQELITLTEYTSKKKMIEWLTKYRIPFMLSRDGTPKVNRDALAHIMGAPNASTPPETIELNFDQEGFN